MYHVTGNEKKATFKIITTLHYTTPHFAILPHTTVAKDIEDFLISSIFV